MDEQSLARRLWGALPKTREGAKSLKWLAKEASTSVGVARTYVRSWVTKGAVGEAPAKRNPREKLFWRQQSEYVSSTRVYRVLGDLSNPILVPMTEQTPAEKPPWIDITAFHLVEENLLQARRYRPFYDSQDAAHLLARTFEPLSVSISDSVPPQQAARLLRSLAQALEQWPSALTHLPGTIRGIIREGQIAFDDTQLTTEQHRTELQRWIAADRQRTADPHSPHPPEETREDGHQQAGSPE